MTPSARIAAAIEILDAAEAGVAVERVLTTWGRKNRYAGSGDRAAIRDLVFDAVRCRRSFGWVGGGGNGRGLMIGHTVTMGGDLDAVFSGDGHAPAPLTDPERSAMRPLDTADRAVRLDIQDWLLPEIDRSLGAHADTVMEELRHRAPVVLRANLLLTTRDGAIEAIAKTGVEAEAHALSQTAIEVRGRVRGLQNSDAFQAGLFEFQDAASQAVVDRLVSGLRGATVLDYCAGGGGKALALAAYGARVVAHDADPSRMRDLPARARRAGAEITIAESPAGTFDLVFCDAPCSGSGAWRRQPEGKWLLTRERLEALNATQDAVLDQAVDHVAPGGRLAFATCSLFQQENGDRVDAFLDRHPDWREIDRLCLTPEDGGDGFFLGVFARA